MTNLSNLELRRYKKQIMLSEVGEKGQEKLKNSSVLIIGAGGLGAPVLYYLSAMGVGTIGISDNDLVEESNLQRQVLYGAGDLGKQKAIVAKQRLGAQYPMINYNIHNICIADENIDFILKKYDIIVDATDNYPTRYLLDEYCRKIKKPLVYGAIYKFEGQISVFHYQQGPGLSDIFPEMPDSNSAARSSDTGIIGVLPAVLGSMQANEVIKIITGAGSVLSGEMLYVDILNNNYQKLSIKQVN